MGHVAGVVGRIGQTEAERIVRRMVAAMSYRGGVDAAPITVDRGEADPKLILSGEQFLGDEARGLWGAMEGEIYTAPRLDEHRKIKSPSSAPLGVLLEQLARAGSDFPRTTNGAYTAALWSRADRTLYLVRDHAGCRSIYYAPIKDGLVFASTAAAIITSGLVDRTIDPESVDGYFGVKALSPPRTMFKNVFALRPGHVLVWKDGKFHQHDYWRLHEISDELRATQEDLRAELQSTIKDAVRIRQQAGGSYCALVSGGVDTSAVATILTQSSDAPRPLHGLSIAFDEVTYSDASLQDIMVKTLGVDQHERILKPSEFAETLTRAVGFLDSPVNDAALVGMYAAFGMVRGDGYDVVFDGEGPDELFPAGNTQGERSIAGLLQLPWPLRRATFGLLATSMPIGNSLLDRVRRVCARLALPDDERRLTWRPLYHTEARRQLLSRNYCTGMDPYEVGKDYLGLTKLKDPLNRYQYGLIKTFLPDDLLYKNERMAAAHNIMNRTPLVDHRLIELALRIPSRYQIEKPTPTTDGIKLLYKAALRGIVPDEIIDRKKERGFSQPTQIWFAGPLKAFLHDHILDRRAVDRGFFNVEFLQRLFDEHSSGRANHDSILTAVLIFNLWMEAQERST